MLSQVTCDVCDSPLSETAFGGNCPRCLMDLVPEKSPSGDPTVREEMAACFPELDFETVLGQSMGLVFRVRQRELGRTAVLKLLPAELTNREGFKERFAQEARLTASLSHPKIATLYEFGERNGHYFILMEYVPGMNLRELVQAGSLPATEACEIVVQICEGLELAHKKGVVHRDLKPENVMIDEEGHVKLIDFGIAKLIDDQSRDLPKTQEHHRLGTMAYMSTEQLTSKDPVDHRSDIYSLGVIFYELLTGEIPHGSFLPPSQIVSCDSQLDLIISQMLAPHRGQRQQSVAEVKSQIQETRRSDSPNSPFLKTIGRTLKGSEGKWIGIAAVLGVLWILVSWGLRFFDSQEHRAKKSAILVDDRDRIWNLEALHKAGLQSIDNLQLTAEELALTAKHEKGSPIPHFLVTIVGEDGIAIRVDPLIPTQSSEGVLHYHANFQRYEQLATHEYDMLPPSMEMAEPISLEERLNRIARRNANRYKERHVKAFEDWREKYSTVAYIEIKKAGEYWTDSSSRTWQIDTLNEFGLTRNGKPSFSARLLKIPVKSAPEALGGQLLVRMKDEKGNVLRHEDLWSYNEPKTKVWIGRQFSRGNTKAWENIYSKVRHIEIDRKWAYPVPQRRFEISRLGDETEGPEKRKKSTAKRKIICTRCINGKTRCPINCLNGRVSFPGEDRTSDCAHCTDRGYNKCRRCGGSGFLWKYSNGVTTSWP